MSINLAIILIFLLVLVVLFWVMNDKEANSVTSSFTSLSQVLPISKIADAIIEYFKSKKNNDKL